MLKTRTGQVSILLILAALFGGGGSGYGFSNLGVQLTALTILALNYDAVRQFFASAPRSMIALVISALALPVLQLVPLPATVWSTLPGRQLVVEAYSFANGPQWSAFSVNQTRTFLAFISLIAPFAVIAIGSSLGISDLSRIMAIVIGLGVLNLIPGIAEVLGNDGQSLLYPSNRMPGVMFGLFANRNSAGLFLDCCLLLLMALPVSKRSAFGTFSRLLIGTLLALGVILTQSRSSIALLILPACLAAARAMASHTNKSSVNFASASRVFVAAGIAAVITISLIPILGETRLSTIADRFEQGDGQRSSMWEDAHFAAKRYWPVGSGIGTFDDVFQVDESLEYISPRRAGRAHNDYIELAIESGVAGLALVIGWAAWIALAAWRAVSTPQRWPALAGAGILVAVALQSILDFPLRNQTMLCIAAFAILLIAPARKPKPGDDAFAAELAL